MLVAMFARFNLVRSASVGVSGSSCVELRKEDTTRAYHDVASTEEKPRRIKIHTGWVAGQVRWLKMINGWWAPKGQNP